MSNWDDQRRAMIDEQLRARGIPAGPALDALGRVPRERFVRSEHEHLAYSDQAMSIDCEQTISQPYIVALMTHALEVQPTDTVLEIGTGSGYQTAVLAELARHVVTIERHEPLSRQAAARLESLGYRNVTTIVGDGALGYPPAAPYDVILAAAAATAIPPALVEQLKDGGRLVIPLGNEDQQLLQLWRKEDGRMVASDLSACRFVPFVGA